MTRSRRLPEEVRTDQALHRALNGWQAAAVALDSVDEVTTELVRLRCASHHDCHT